MKPSLATRFVNAYNLLDHSLRVQYNFKTNIAFSDLIRRCSSLNQVIRLYEDDLIDLARLRNAIVHSRSEQIIAEPHEEVVELIEKVARIISTPPLAIDSIKSVEVDIMDSEATLHDFIIKSYRVGHGNIPVYKKNILIGVLQRNTFMEAFGKVLEENRNIQDFLTKTTVEEYLREFPYTNHFTIVSSKITIEEILELFGNRKLACVLVTENGTSGAGLLGIITNADIIDLMQILEGY